MQPYRMNTTPNAGTDSDRPLVNGDMKANGQTKKFEPPPKSILDANVLRLQYKRMRSDNVEREKLWAEFEGMFDGNPPFDPADLEKEGLGHKTNVNFRDASKQLKSLTQTYYALNSSVKNLVRFDVLLEDKPDKNQEYGRIMSEEMTRVLRQWRQFSSRTNFFRRQMTVFGYSVPFWPDERDWRFEVASVYNTLFPEKTKTDISHMNLICYEHEYTAQDLWGYYFKAEKNDSSEWNKEALKKVLLGASTRQAANYEESVFQRLLIDVKTNNVGFDKLYNDDITLVTCFTKEIGSSKVSNYKIHPKIDTGEDFVFSAFEQYEEFSHAVAQFTFDEGEEFLHAVKGVAHEIAPQMLAITMAKNSANDQARRGGSLILSTKTGVNQDARAVDFVFDDIIDVGDADIKQNNLGSSLGSTIKWCQFLQADLQGGLSQAGLNMKSPDPEKMNPGTYALQASDEASLQKIKVDHHYDEMDFFYREIIRKMLYCKKSYPGHDYVEDWQEACIERGVPKEMFDTTSFKKGLFGLPKHIKVYATRKNGTGSQVADQLLQKNLMSIGPMLGAVGRENALEDYVEAFGGWRAVDRYLPAEDRERKATSDDSVAILENNALENGEPAKVGEDQDHIAHLTAHFERLTAAAKAYNEGQYGTAIDDEAIIELPLALAQQLIKEIPLYVLFAYIQQALPHCASHIIFLDQDPLEKAAALQMKNQWGQLVNFGKMIQAAWQAKSEALFKRIDEQARKRIQLSSDDQLKREEMLMKHEREMYKIDQRFQQNDVSNRFENSLKDKTIELKAMNQSREISLAAANKTHENMLFAAVEAAKPQKGPANEG